MTLNNPTRGPEIQVDITMSAAGARRDLFAVDEAEIPLLNWRGDQCQAVVQSRVSISTSLAKAAPLLPASLG